MAGPLKATATLAQKQLRKAISALNKAGREAYWDTYLPYKEQGAVYKEQHGDEFLYDILKTFENEPYNLPLKRELSRMQDYTPEELVAALQSEDVTPEYLLGIQGLAHSASPTGTFEPFFTFPELKAGNYVGAHTDTPEYTITRLLSSPDADAAARATARFLGEKKSK